ncbi:phage terminase, large subunit, PBSX family [Lysinibacillus sp. AC-3]|nr:phage terminase, large subunit, PBSX family [Lysinibacillus sp. AC-3]
MFTEIIEDLGLSGKVKTSSSPMTVKFPNGTKVIFQGMDKPEKLKSINNISLIWLEECSEIKYSGFKELLGRLRHPTLDLFMILIGSVFIVRERLFKL